MPGIDTAQLTDELIADEDLRLLVYDDATGLPLRIGQVLKGHPSIGIGRALDVHGISREEALYLCRNDIDGVAVELDNALPWFSQLDSVRAGVLANMTFNMGLGGLAGFHNMLSAVQAGKYDLAAEEMLASKWAVQVGGRAKKLAARMRTGVA
jgi:lysozyme